MEKVKEKISRIQQLDKILQFLSNNYLSNMIDIGLSEKEISAYVNREKIYFVGVDLRKAIDKLLHDKYIDKLDNGNYAITWLGQYFVEYEKGYEEKKSKADEANQNLKNQNWMLSRGAIFASVFSGLLLCVELIRLYRELTKCSCHHN